MLEFFLYKGFNEMFYAHMTLYIVMNSVYIYICNLHVVECMLFAIGNTKVMQFYHCNPMMGFMNHLRMFTWMLMPFFFCYATFFLAPCFEQKNWQTFEGCWMMKQVPIIFYPTPFGFSCKIRLHFLCPLWYIK